MSWDWKRKYIKDVILTIIIILLPFTLAVHLMYSEETDILHFYGYHYAHGYVNNSTFIWTFTISVIPIALFSIWFLNTTYWWRYFILGVIFSNVIYLADILCSGAFDVHCIWVSILAFLLFLFLTDRYTLRHIANNEHTFSISFLRTVKGNFREIYHQVKRSFSGIESQKEVTQDTDYVKKLYHAKSVLDKDVLTRGMVKKPVKIRPKVELFLVALLTLTPVLYFVHRAIPVDKTVLQWGGIVIGSNGFPDVHTFIWYITLKICIILPLCIWFITSQHWWRYSILCPIVIFTHQLWASLQHAKATVDEMEFMSALPIILFLILILVVLSQAIKYQSKILDIYEQISKEIETLLSTINARDAEVKRMQLQFDKLKNKEITEPQAKQQLDALLALKIQLEKQLKDKKN